MHQHVYNRRHRRRGPWALLGGSLACICWRPANPTPCNLHVYLLSLLWLAAAGRGNIDGEPIQGTLADFMARQVELLGPRRVVLGHHDDWLPGFSIPTNVDPIRDALHRANPDVELLEMGYLDATVVLPV